MRNKLFITNGTLILALAASVFIGCQDFMGGDKGDQPAAPSGDDLQNAAQALSTQDSAKDSPAQTVATPPKATTPPPSPVVETPTESTPPAVQPAPPASTSLTPQQQECLDAYNVMQSGTGDSYAQAKDLYVGKDCDQVLNAVKPNPRPYTPPTTAELCAMYRKNVVTQPTTGDPKYDAYMAQQAIMCADYP
jgi:hypothetical protein